jgi:hypothetical protein
LENIFRACVGLPPQNEMLLEYKAPVYGPSNGISVANGISTNGVAKGIITNGAGNGNIKKITLKNENDTLVK